MPGSLHDDVVVVLHGTPEPVPARDPDEPDDTQEKLQALLDKQMQDRWRSMGLIP